MVVSRSARRHGRWTRRSFTHARAYSAKQRLEDAEAFVRSLAALRHSVQVEMEAAYLRRDDAKHIYSLVASGWEKEMRGAFVDSNVIGRNINGRNNSKDFGWASIVLLLILCGLGMLMMIFFTPAANTTFLLPRDGGRRQLMNVTVEEEPRNFDLLDKNYHLRSDVPGVNEGVLSLVATSMVTKDVDPHLMRTEQNTETGNETISGRRRRTSWMPPDEAVDEPKSTGSILGTAARDDTFKMHQQGHLKRLRDMRRKRHVHDQVAKEQARMSTNRGNVGSTFETRDMKINKTNSTRLIVGTITDSHEHIRVLQEEEVLDNYDDEYVSPCGNGTVEMTVTMIVGMALNDDLKWTIHDKSTGEILLQQTDTNISASEDDMQYFWIGMCIDLSKCYVISMSGIFYGFYNVELDGGNVATGFVEDWNQINGAGYVNLGSGCVNLCDAYQPLLSPTNEIIPGMFDSRAHEIITVLTSVSGSEVLADVTTPQYRAACWIIHEDLRHVSVTPTVTNRNKIDHFQMMVQRYVVATIFFSIGGDSWSINHGILGPGDACSWGHDGLPTEQSMDNPAVGIRCDAATGKVTTINFRTAVEFSEIVPGGIMVSEILKLHHLENLILSGNNLHGTIPETIGNDLSNLSTLDLSDNEMSGTIPPSISHAVNLTYLDLEGNKFVGSIPNELFSLVRLIVLDLSTNVFSGTISTKIGQLPALQNLFLDKNKLTGTVPAEIGMATHLSLLTIPDNRLSGTIPPELMNTARLLNLDLSDNALTGTIPPELTKLSYLKELVLSNNLLTGRVPKTIGDMTELEKLSLSDNPGLSGEVPPSLGKLLNLTQLRLHNSSLTGNVPEELCNSSSLALSSADCDGRISVPKVTCACCKRCYGQFSKKQRIGDCPDGEVWISVNFSGGFVTDWEGVWWELKEESTDAVLIEEGPYSWVIPDSATFRTCVSSTDCFTFHADMGIWGDVDLKTLDGFYQILTEDGSVIHDGTWERQTVHFGYSNTAASKVFQRGQCDAIQICGVRVPEPRGSRRRDVFDRLVKVTGLNRLKDPATPHHRAACWIIDEDNRKLDAADNTLVQRYVLALLHFNYNAWAYAGTDEMPPSTPHECDWPGIRCSEHGIVIEVDLSSRGLQGALLHEIGDLPLLEVLRLRENELTSTIPVELANLWSLVELDLGNNEFHLTLPRSIGELSTLKKLVLCSNKLEGTLPREVFLLTQLTHLDISDNLLRGEFATEVGTLLALERLDLSANFFAGKIPPELAHVPKLKHLHLSANQFSGSIPPNLFHISSLIHLGLYSNQLEGRIPDGLSNVKQLEELQLHDNELTGSISDELGMLSHLRTVTLSYNELKGSVPSSLAKLGNIEMLNLHGNLLTGDAPDVKGSSDYFQYITDCGDPNYVENSISCESCTVCCNSEQKCQEPDKTRISLKEQTAILMMGLFLIVVFMGTGGMLLVKMKCLKLQSFTKSKALHLCGDESVYSFMLTKNKLGHAIFLMTIIIQVFIFKIFIVAANFGDENNDWEYSVRCPENGTGCEDENEVTWVGWTMFALLFFVYLAPDLINGMRLVYKAAAHISLRCLSSGTVLVMITVLSVWTSTYYTKATAMTDSLLIMDAVVLLFINDMDERVFFVLDNMYPTFVENMLIEADVFSNKLEPDERRVCTGSQGSMSSLVRNGRSSNGAEHVGGFDDEVDENTSTEDLSSFDEMQPIRSS